jgi:hypothetical protein
MQCAAKCKATGDQCRRRAVKGKRVCTVHGGLTPVGSASPHYKSGRYSRHLPARLSERYSEAQTDKRLLELRDEIALVDTRLADLLPRVDDASDDYPIWHEVFAAIDQRRRLVESERRRMVEAGQMLSVEQAMLMIGALTDIARQHITDTQALAAIAADVDRFITDN